MRAIILDDHPAHVEPLKDLFLKNGFTDVKLVTHSKEFYFEFLKNDYQLAVVDLLLSEKRNGTELLDTISNFKHYCSIWAVSGVFKESRTSSRVIKASDCFLSKPFDIKLAQAELDKVFVKKSVEIQHTFLHSLVENLSMRNVQELLQAHSEMKGYEILALCALLSSNEFNGQLCVEFKKSKRSTIYFSSGHITHLEYPDRKSYFGVLLAKAQETLRPREIKQYLKLRSKKKIGEKLVSHNKIDINTVRSVLSDQIQIRLDYLINSGESFRVSLQEDEPKDSNIIFIKDVHYHLRNFLFSNKFTLNAVDDYLSSIEAYSLTHSEGKDALNTKDPGIRKCADVLSMIDGYSSMRDSMKRILVQLSFDLKEIHKILFYLLITKQLSLKESQEQAQKKNRVILDKVRLLSQKLEAKEYKDVFAINENSSKEEVKKHVLSMISAFHTDHFQHVDSQELHSALNGLNIKLMEIKQILVDGQNESQRISDKLVKDKNTINYYLKQKQAKEQLEKRKYGKALEILQDFIDNNNDDVSKEEINLYYSWAYLKDASTSKTQPDLDRILSILNEAQVSLENSALHFFVKGLYNNTANNQKSAESCFKKSMSIQPDFLPAKLELMDLQSSQKKGLLSMLFSKAK